MRVLCPLLIALWLSVPAAAQIKPSGVFDIAACHARPVWASFALLPDDADFEAAADCQRTSGLQWVLALFGSSPYVPVESHARAVHTRAQAAGVRFVAVLYHEEWYEYALTPGALPIPGLDAENPAHERDIISVVRWWIGEQHAAIARVFPGLPRVWLTSLANDDPSLGPWRPVPPGTTAIALEAYVPDGYTWEATAGRYIGHALRTRREPIVLVGQGFQSDGDPYWGGGPTQNTVDGFARALRQPGVWGAWMFTWGDRPGMRGLSSLDHWRQQYEHALGVR